MYATATLRPDVRLGLAEGRGIMKKERKALSELCGVLAKLGNDLVDSIEKYGGKWDGKSWHMKEAMRNWSAIRQEYFPKEPPKIDPKDMP
jgi:hypothetical protein